MRTRRRPPPRGGVHPARTRTFQATAWTTGRWASASDWPTPDLVAIGGLGSADTAASVEGEAGEAARRRPGPGGASSSRAPARWRPPSRRSCRTRMAVLCGNPALHQ